jgi:hypothetical protein
MSYRTVAADQSAILEAGSLLDLEKTARVLDCSVHTVRRLINAGSLPACQLGGRPHGPLRVSAAALHERIAGWTTR